MEGNPYKNIGRASAITESDEFADQFLAVKPFFSSSWARFSSCFSFRLRIHASIVRHVRSMSASLRSELWDSTALVAWTSPHVRILWSEKNRTSALANARMFRRWWPLLQRPMPWLMQLWSRGIFFAEHAIHKAEAADDEVEVVSEDPHLYGMSLPILCAFSALKCRNWTLLFDPQGLYYKETLWFHRWDCRTPCPASL